MVKLSRNKFILRSLSYLFRASNVQNRANLIIKYILAMNCDFAGLGPSDVGGVTRA